MCPPGQAQDLPLQGNVQSNKIILNDIEQIQSGNYLSKIDKYIKCFYEKRETFLDYLPKNTIIFFDEIGKI